MAIPLWKNAVLNIYYHATLPRRWASRRASERAGQGAPMPVVFYHRIADDGASQWTVGNAVFAKQIRWLRDHFEIVSLAEAQRRIRERTAAGRPAVAITFDDGYSENCRSAIPLLVKHKIPCTYFVTLKHILDGTLFAHDAELGINAPPNTMEQLRVMSGAGVEIGAHCFRHLDLGGIDDERILYEEVVVPRRRLQEELGCPIRYFAFPYAQYMNLNSKVFQIAAEAGYDGVVSGYGGYNWPAGDPFHIERIPVDNDLIRLKNRATVDPRTARPPRFRYKKVSMITENTKTCSEKSEN